MGSEFSLLDIPGWEVRSESPQLPSGQIHLWRFSVGGGSIRLLKPWLSADERQRAAGFRLPDAGERFCRTRGLLRWVLAGYLGSGPGDLRFSYGDQGKPVIGNQAGALAFNLSHAGDWAVLAVSRDAALGVDLEKIRDRALWKKIARRAFGASACEALERLPPEPRMYEFYRHWTGLEARIKAGGEGLFHQLGKTPEGSWKVRHFEPAPGYLAAVAAACPPQAPEGWRWLQPPPALIP